MALTYTCEGTQGANVATGDFSPALSQITLSGGTATYDTSMAAQGKTGIKVVSSTTGVATLRAPADASNATQSVSFEVSIPSNSSPQALWFHTARYASGAVMKLGIDASNHPYIVDAGNTTINTGTATLTPGSMYRVAYVLTAGTSTSNGSLTLHIYPHGSSTAAYTYSTTAGNFGTNPIVAFDYGVLTQPTAATTAGFDSIQNTAGSTTELGALVTPLSATIAVSPNSGTLPLAVTGTVTPAGGSGSYSCSVDWGDGSTSNATNGAGPFSLSHTYNDSASFTNRTVTATVSEL